jgi:hypothetical protein
MTLFEESDDTVTLSRLIPRRVMTLFEESDDTVTLSRLIPRRVMIYLSGRHY